MQREEENEEEDVLETGGAMAEASAALDSMEQVEKCWKEYLKFGEVSVVRICCDLDQDSMEYIVKEFQQPPPSWTNSNASSSGERGETDNNTSVIMEQQQRLFDCVEELELDLCTFRDDASLTLLTSLMRCQMPHLKQVEVENRLLETPWDSWIVSTFLEKGGLHQLEKLVLYGVELCGMAVGQSFQRLLSTSPQSEMKLHDLTLCFCHLDRSMIERLVEGIRHNTQLKKLTLYEGSIDDEMLVILVERGLSLSCNHPDGGRKNSQTSSSNRTSTKICQLHTLNLGRNQITFKSLPMLATLLQSQAQLEFLSLSHNVELFRGEEEHFLIERIDERSMGDNDDDDDQEGCDIVVFNKERKDCTSVGLTRRVLQRPSTPKTPHELFWAAFYQHTRLLTFWAQSPVSDVGDPSNLAEQRAESIVRRNLRLKHVTCSLLPFSLWPRALVACCCYRKNESIHQKSLVFAFLRFRIEAWMTFHQNPSTPPLHHEKVKSV